MTKDSMYLNQSPSIHLSLAPWLLVSYLNHKHYSRDCKIEEQEDLDPLAKSTFIGSQGIICDCCFDTS
jgi:hypothetical protein